MANIYNEELDHKAETQEMKERIKILVKELKTYYPDVYLELQLQILEDLKK